MFKKLALSVAVFCMFCSAAMTSLNAECSTCKGKKRAGAFEAAVKPVTEPAKEGKEAKKEARN